MDIVERLREYETWSEDWPIIKEAADEIERLRGMHEIEMRWANDCNAEVKLLREALEFYANPEHYEYKRGDMNVMSNVEWNEIVLDDGKIARSALQQKESE